MATQKALWLTKVGEPLTIGQNTIPEPGPGDILVKNESVSLNPMDWIFPKVGFYMMKNFPVVIGEEGAGVVVKLGEGVTNLAVGDRVYYATKFNFESDYAAFQEYTLISADIAGKLPANLSFDQGASICIGIAPFTAATYVPEPHGHGYTPPFESEGGVGKYKGHPILIMAGGASLGQYAIQLARLSGFSPIITTASLHNKDLLISLGATHVLDRKLSASQLKEEVANITSTPVMYAFDSISLDDTRQAAYDILAPGGKLTVVRRGSLKEVEGSGKGVVQAFGSFELPRVREFGGKFMRELDSWLAEGKIKPNRVEVLPGGLHGIAAGLERLESGAVSATKFIVRPQETV
ncbi:hypothetical protein HYDPIDRAFT_183963 [Hydnomerulius pinastri MD-312]|uniref:Enoyl reductase (ER) domain-containing protein n=1 Tax=Hydnomerulius pinastri MD-312 TaxID=994086 RepID=A0A0C9V315_9AGAM|nr:hypothetical protein HYDPIDRAFT_183963 [Hydnomerulius pinastri MD-312]